MLVPADLDGYFTGTRHAEHLARPSFDDRRVCSQSVDLPPETRVLRLDRVDLAFELYEIPVCFYEAQEAALAEKGVDYRRCDDQKGGEPQSFLFDFRFLKALHPLVAATFIARRNFRHVGVRIL